MVYKSKSACGFALLCVFYCNAMWQEYPDGSALYSFYTILTEKVILSYTSIKMAPLQIPTVKTLHLFSIHLELT